MRYYLTPCNLAVIKKTRDKCWERCVEREILCTFFWKCILVQPLWKRVWRILKKLKIELPYNPAIPLLGIYPKEMKILTRKDICTHMFIAALIYNSQDMETTYVSINGWREKEDVIYIYIHIYISISICI